MKQKGSKTKHKIIDESLQLFSVKGYYNTSINNILEAANITKGGLYGHFDSKQDIWIAVYEKAVTIWKEIVFQNIELIDDPVERIQKTLENDLQNYLGQNVFEGGCIFLNMLVELSGQSNIMSRRVLKGIIGFSRLIKIWLREADEKKMLKTGVNIDEIANFIVISLNGCAALYSSTKDSKILDITNSQLNCYLEQIRK